MALLRKLLTYLAIGFLLLIAALDVWGYLTLGTIEPDANAFRDPQANRVVMVFGATGSAGDGLLKAAMADPEVENIHVVTRRLSPRIQAGQDSGRLQVHMHQDYTDYSELAAVLADVNTVLWGLGTSSLQVDEQTYTRIHVDFPLAFLESWLAQRQEAPMSFHFITGVGTGPDESAKWAQDKAHTERVMTEMAQGTGLRTFSYRSAWIRPTSENANPLIYLGEMLLQPGRLVIRGIDLGFSMLEISARTLELANGTLIDNEDSLRYAAAYHRYHGD